MLLLLQSSDFLKNVALGKSIEQSCLARLEAQKSDVTTFGKQYNILGNMQVLNKTV